MNELQTFAEKKLNPARLALNMGGWMEYDGSRAEQTNSGTAWSVLICLRRI